MYTEHYGVDISKAGEMTGAMVVENSTVARMQLTAPTLSTAVIELLCSIDGQSWALFNPTVELSAAGVTDPVIVAGLRYIRGRVKTAEATPSVVAISFWAGELPVVLS